MKSLQKCLISKKKSEKSELSNPYPSVLLESEAYHESGDDDSMNDKENDYPSFDIYNSVKTKEDTKAAKNKKNIFSCAIFSYSYI